MDQATCKTYECCDMSQSHVTSVGEWNHVKSYGGYLDIPRYSSWNTNMTILSLRQVEIGCAGLSWLDSDVLEPEFHDTGISIYEAKMIYPLVTNIYSLYSWFSYKQWSMSIAMLVYRPWHSETIHDLRDHRGHGEHRILHQRSNVDFGDQRWLSYITLYKIIYP